MGFEQLAALKAQLTKEAKFKQQQERADEPAAEPATQQRAKPAAKADRPARPAQPGGNGRPGGGHVRPEGRGRTGEKEKAPPVDPVVRVIGKLQKRFPAAFPKNPAPKVPLKVGVLADLIAQASDLQLTEAEIREAVSTWCRGSRYWACLTDGAARVDLTGAPAGVVTARDAAFARNQAKGGAGGRRKARGKAAAGNSPTAANTAQAANTANTANAVSAEPAGEQAQAEAAEQKSAEKSNAEENSDSP
jgi:ProP effector